MCASYSTLSHVLHVHITPFHQHLEKYCQVVWTRTHCTSRSVSLVRQEISKMAVHYLSLQQHWWILVLKWTRLFLKNLKEPVTWSYSWIVKFPTVEFSQLSTLLLQARVETTC